MQKLIILCALFFVGINAKSCADKLKELQAKPPMLGAFRPKCQSNGQYAETQCHENYCFCVDPQSGEELLGTRLVGKRPKSCKKTACVIQRHNVIKAGSMPGAFQPQCEDDGSFKKAQCYGSTGYCYCVFPETGEKVLGTEKRFSEPKNCELTDCMRERHTALKGNLLGAFRPKCKETGEYEEVQCKEGFCYCVFPETGKEVLGSRLNVRGQRPKSCEVTKCVTERHEALASKLLGAYIPKCVAESGEYEKVQCKAGFCYCVNSKGEKIAGTGANRRGVRPNCDLKPCIMERIKSYSLMRRGLLGVYTPRCESNGDYSKLQCRNGMCWCAETKTGKPLDTQPNKENPWTIPNC